MNWPWNPNGMWCGTSARASSSNDAASSTSRNELDEWRADPDTDLYELRDPGLLKLFCGADPKALAEAQLERHERRLASYEGMLDEGDLPTGMRLALEAGIGHQREYVRFWRRVLEESPQRRSRKVRR